MLVPICTHLLSILPSEMVSHQIAIKKNEQTARYHRSNKWCATLKLNIDCMAQKNKADRRAPVIL